MSERISFEVINPDGIPVMGCCSIPCLPTFDQIDDMNKAGYKFKLNQKKISAKALKDYIKENRIVEGNID